MAEHQIFDGCVTGLGDETASEKKFNVCHTSSDFSYLFIKLVSGIKTKITNTFRTVKWFVSWCWMLTSLHCKSIHNEFISMNIICFLFTLDSSSRLIFRERTWPVVLHSPFRVPSSLSFSSWTEIKEKENRRFWISYCYIELGMEPWRSRQMMPIKTEIDSQSMLGIDNFEIIDRFKKIYMDMLREILTVSV